MDGPTRAAKPTPTAPPVEVIRRSPLTRSPIRHRASQLARVAQDRAIPPVECLVERWGVGTASLARPFSRDANQLALPVFGLRVLSHFSRQLLGKKRQQLLRIVDRRTGPTL